MTVGVVLTHADHRIDRRHGNEECLTRRVLAAMVRHLEHIRTDLARDVGELLCIRRIDSHIAPTNSVASSHVAVSLTKQQLIPDAFDRVLV